MCNCFGCNCKKIFIKFLFFSGGFTVGMIYYYVFLRKIPFPYQSGFLISVVLSTLLGIGTASCRQLKCVCLLLVPMYCGKPGRGVLKVVIFTYVIAGPITNMSENAREAVRVFACNSQFAANMSRIRQQLVSRPFKQTMRDLNPEIDEIKATLRSFKAVLTPLQNEIESKTDVCQARKENDYMDDMLKCTYRSGVIERRNRPIPGDEKSDMYRKTYLKKLEYRCELLFTYATAVCMKSFARAHDVCLSVAPEQAASALCRPMLTVHVCNVSRNGGECYYSDLLDHGFGENYAYLRKVSSALMDTSDSVQLFWNITDDFHKYIDISNTAQHLIEILEEKLKYLKFGMATVHISVAIVALRILRAAIAYHDAYLTDIDYDNVYVSNLFMDIDKKRKRRGRYTILPLKKLESPKLVDPSSINCPQRDRHGIPLKFLKVALEALTATTFVMLDSMLRRTLEGVVESAKERAPEDLRIDVEGTGAFASIVRKIIKNLETFNITQDFSSKACLPHARSMGRAFYFYIYGGYLWIFLLTCLNTFTGRLNRLICSYFYPKREKLRALHLYNDMLKRRRRLPRVLRRQAVSACRAHLLSRDNLLSLRVRYPMFLGWLKILPVARMKCLICEELEPRNLGRSPWHRCEEPACPFVYCPACWQDAGERCAYCRQSCAHLYHDYSEEETR